MRTRLTTSSLPNQILEEHSEFAREEQYRLEAYELLAPSDAWRGEHPAMLSNLGHYSATPWEPTRAVPPQAFSSPWRAGRNRANTNLRNWANLKRMVLTPAQRSEAFCSISQRFLTSQEPLLLQPIAYVEGDVVHIFEWACLNIWLGSPAYRCTGDRKLSFTNPYNRQLVAFSELRRIDPDPEAGR